VVTRRLFGDAREWTRDLAVATGVGLFLGLVGPFGSYLNSPRVVVVGYWVAVLWIGAAVFGLAQRPVLRAFAPRGLLAVVMLAAATLATVIPLSLLCRFIAQAIWPGPIGRISALEWYTQALVISTPITIGYALLDGLFRPGSRSGAGSATAEPADGAPGNFLSRLPIRLGRELLALQMEDHYVRAHTSRGSTLILVPLRQAIGELNGLPGLKVHRSWWVARGAVASVIQDGRNLRLRLSNGIEAPVARTSVAAVRAAGFLEEQGRGAAGMAEAQTAAGE
jgi:hypothetical protein